MRTVNTLKMIILRSLYYYQGELSMKIVNNKRGRPKFSNLDSIIAIAWSTEVRRIFSDMSMYAIAKELNNKACDSVISARSLQKIAKGERSPALYVAEFTEAKYLAKTGPCNIKIWDAYRDGIYDESDGCERLGDQPSRQAILWHTLACHVADYYSIESTHMTQTGEGQISSYASEKSGLTCLLDIPAIAIIRTINELKYLGELQRFHIDEYQLLELTDWALSITLQEPL